jgi:hypothetical protein
VKDAKSEAQKEIEEYRSQKDSEFKKFETEVNTTVASTFAASFACPSEHECAGSYSATDIS